MRNDWRSAAETDAAGTAAAGTETGAVAGTAVAGTGIGGAAGRGPGAGVAAPCRREHGLVGTAGRTSSGRTGETGFRSPSPLGRRRRPCPKSPSGRGLAGVRRGVERLGGPTGQEDPLAAAGRGISASNLALSALLRHPGVAPRSVRSAQAATGAHRPCWPTEGEGLLADCFLLSL